VGDLSVLTATGGHYDRERYEVLAVAESTTDQTILKRIQGLIYEEQEPYGKGGLGDDDQLRLEAVKIELDQCWDLLLQREAKREFGQNPNDAKVRPSSIVEG
jgi:hypothetical protein